MKNRSDYSYAPQLSPLDTPVSISLPKMESQRLPRHCCVSQAARSPQMPTLN
ncbi:hypothetical protein [Laspinema olomoucense]|uniref:Uncharacterized protein n=1 Tax=Laspinema olomoucense D3b TaxID=2953688 RepID=A0ABT2ND20_9CYAN|nr:MULTISPECIES: hypothetical protein [unclassified Laspinema]MCT7975288.1 hypothetical protein [Laspinema sp. D3d]MCT7980589.1 hypothetical protein [Laspinema sp. D3b]MCT7991140.1 hypothetical protein [Laspinema sp. D3a]MCT7996152.1 hypothetical protein [Laspinema sp. D3c]